MSDDKKGLKKLLVAKQLLRVLGAQSASVYANQVIAFVIPWLVLTRTGSATNAGFVAFAIAVTAFIGTLTGGLVTDRVGGRKVSMIADGLSFATALLLAITLIFGYFSLWFVIVSQIIGVFFDGPGSIAKNTTIPAAAKEGSVPTIRATGIQQTLQNMAQFIGPVSAGVLIALLTESVTLLVSSALFAVAIYLIARLPRKIMVHEHPLSMSQAYADMKEALLFVVKEPLLGPLQLFGPFFAFVLGPVEAIIFPAWFVFGGQGSATLGLFLGVQALGGVLGGFLFAALAPKVSQRKWWAGATALYALALFGLFFTRPGSRMAVALGFFGGLAITGIFAVPYTAFFARTPERLLGRTGSLGAAAGYLVVALASLFFGWLVNTISAQNALLACAIAMSILAVGVLSLPFLKHLDKHIDPEAVKEAPTGMPTMR